MKLVWTTLSASPKKDLTNINLQKLYEFCLDNFFPKTFKMLPCIVKWSANPDSYVMPFKGGAANIFINKKKRSKTDLFRTLLHEMCHHAEYSESKSTEWEDETGHGSTWRKWMKHVDQQKGIEAWDNAYLLWLKKQYQDKGI